MGRSIAKMNANRAAGAGGRNAFATGPGSVDRALQVMGRMRAGAIGPVPPLKTSLVRGDSAV